MRFALAAFHGNFNSREFFLLENDATYTDRADLAHLYKKIKIKKFRGHTLAFAIGCRLDSRPPFGPRKFVGLSRLLYKGGRYNAIPRTQIWFIL